METPNTNIEFISAIERHENLRKQCWIQAVASVAGATNCSSSEVAINWATKILIAFDKTFPYPEIQQTVSIPKKEN